MYSVYSSTVNSRASMDRLAHRLRSQTWDTPPQAQEEEGDGRRNTPPSTGAPQEAWVRWLRAMKWDWFVTLTCAPRASSEAQVRAQVAAWLRVLRTHQPRAYAACVVECGEHLGGWHAHVLLGGVGAHPEWPRVLAHAWRACGAAHVSRYSPALDAMRSVFRGASAYLVKELPQTSVEIHGRLRRFRPRVRKERATRAA